MMMMMISPKRGGGFPSLQTPTKKIRIKMKPPDDFDDDYKEIKHEVAIEDDYCDEDDEKQKDQPPKSTPEDDDDDNQDQFHQLYQFESHPTSRGKNQ